MLPQEKQAREMIENLTLPELFDEWDLTTKAKPTPELATVRGWMMDEFEKRNPEGFNAWVDCEWPEDSDARKYIGGK